MTSYQNAVEYVSNQMQQGKMDADEANVAIVQMMGVRVIHGSLPKQVRQALNSAVKSGELGHIKADGLKPEVYHHKNARGRALDAQERIARESISNISKCYA